MSNEYKFVIIIRNIKDPNTVVSGGVSNKYKGAYKEIFDILDKDSIFVQSEVEDEVLKGNDFYLYFNSFPDADKIKQISKIPNVEILGNSFGKGGRTIAQTPAPIQDRVYGSDLNKSGSSENMSSAKSIKFDEKTLDAIKNKVFKHNEQYPNKRINLASAKAVVRRGMGAYSKSHRPTISDGKPNNRVAWGLARLNAFIYKIVNGKSKSGNYNQDDDFIKELGYEVSNYENGGESDILLAPNGSPSNLNYEQYKLVRTPAFKKWFGDWENDPINSSKVVDENGEPMVVYHGTDKSFSVFDIDKISYNSGNFGHYGYGFYFSNDLIESQYYGNEIMSVFLNLKNPFTATNEQYLQLKNLGYELPDIEDKKIKIDSLLSNFKNDKKTLNFINDFKNDGYELAWENLLKEKNTDSENDFYNDLSRILDYTEYGYEEGLYDYIYELLDGYDLKVDFIKGFEYQPSLHYVLDVGNLSMGFTKDVKELGYDGVIYGSEYVAFRPNQIKLANNTNTSFDENNNDVRFDKGGKLKKNGDCYIVSGRIAMGLIDKEVRYKGIPYLVHAEVKHSTIDGIRFGHAFIEDDENVYDFSNNREIIIPKQLYYYFGDINPKNKKKYRKYTFEEAMEKMTSTGNYGCWDIETEFSEGGTIEDNNTIKAKKIAKESVDKIKYLECDGATRVLHYLFEKNNVNHVVKKGFVEFDNDKIPLHYWIELPDGNVVDYKSKMWLGEKAEEGIFKPNKETKYTGKKIDLKVSKFVYDILTMEQGGLVKSSTPDYLKMFLGH